ncbi:hypothetical protein ACLIA0_09840 [Bacillaceae bacterium W0354]
MKQCHYCGERVEEGKFCGNCGEALECLSCGKEFQGNEAFCTGCGTPRPSSASNQTQAPQQAPVQQNQQSFSAKFGMDGQDAPYEGNQSNPYVEQPAHQQPAPPTQPRPANSNGIKVIAALAAVAAIIFIYFTFFTGPSTPEEVVEAFFDAVEKQDINKVKKYVDSSVHSEIDFTDFPRDAKFTIIKYDEVEIEGNDAFIDATINVKSRSEGVDETEWFYIYLEKRNGDWIIYDMY